MDFEAIIMGANYAGLAAAGELGGKRVLLLDREPVGSHQASTCALWTRVIEVLGAEYAILHTLDTWHVHVGDREFSFPTPAHRISVLDHSKFCAHLFSRSDAEFRQETVQSIHTQEVITNKGSYEAPLIIEALGWRGLRQRDQNLRQKYNQALETEVRVDSRQLFGEDNALHIYFSPRRWGRGGGWVFPSGKTTRIGFGRFEGAGKLTRPLSQLLDDYVLLPSARLYGNYIPWKLNKATARGRFIAGDAAGQCLGLLSEGIRTAIYFGIAAARCARKVLDHESTAKDALDLYEGFVNAHRRCFQLFSFLQIILPRLPVQALQTIAGNLESTGLGTRILYWYAQLFDVPALIDSAAIDRKRILQISRQMQTTMP
jgi:menaquinone-9 beta-reductase